MGMSVEDLVFKVMELARRVHFREKIRCHIIGALVDWEDTPLLKEPSNTVVSDKHVSRVTRDFRGFH